MAPAARLVARSGRDDGCVDPGDDANSNGGERPDEVVFGSSGPRWPRGPRRLVYLAIGLVVAAVAVAAVTVAVLRQGNGSAASPPPVQPSESRGRSRPVTVTQLSHPVLGVKAGWELFARGDGYVVRIELARGRITRTTVPELASTGPVSFVVQPRMVIIRPFDFVPGYVVPDGRSASPLRASMGGPALPGPKPGQVWVGRPRTGFHPARMVLLRQGDCWRRNRPLTCRTGVTVPIPSGHTVVADSAGYPLVAGTDGTYEARPDGLQRITTGAVVAFSPTRWLTLECESPERCKNVVIDRATRKRHLLSQPIHDLRPFAGVISPDGSTAAVLERHVKGRASLHLVALTASTDQQLAVPIDQFAFPWEQQGVGSQTLVWSPDSRWLFVVARTGRVLAVDRQAQSVHSLGFVLPPIDQIAVRSAQR
jgi:hypothetical protein